MVVRARHKFGAVRTAVNGRKYDSKREARHALELGQKQVAGLVVGWLEQVPVRLPGGVTYRCDFLVFYADGTARFEEVKGVDTPVWRLKHSQVRELYPWMELEVIR